MFPVLLLLSAEDLAEFGVDRGDLIDPILRMVSPLNDTSMRKFQQVISIGSCAC